MDLWILTHPDMRRAAQVRAFTKYIADTFLSDRDLFEGRRPWTEPSPIGHSAR